MPVLVFLLYECRENYTIENLNSSMKQLYDFYCEWKCVKMYIGDDLWFFLCLNVHLKLISDDITNGYESNKIKESEHEHV